VSESVLIKQETPRPDGLIYFLCRVFFLTGDLWFS
jgi:hypothetical protein